MVSEKLKYPFTWEERCPTLHQRVLFVPKFYDKHADWKFPGLDALFGKTGAVFVEYCSGNGDWVVQKAIENPNSLWIAVEKRFDRVRKIWTRLNLHRLENLVIVCGEALTFSRYYLPSHILDGAFVNFPDPWPKLKHSKHRLIQEPFVEEMTRLIKEGGTMTYTTDDIPYSKQMIAQMQKHPAWESVFPDPFYTTEWDNYGSSWFERLWTERGIPVHYMQWKKK